jgi:hypothetical protein
MATYCISVTKKWSIIEVNIERKRQTGQDKQERSGYDKT